MGGARGSRKPPEQIRRMRMASRREAIAPMVERILGAVAPAELPPERQSDLAIALSEALSNAAVHGNKLQPRVTVRITVAVEPGRCAVIDIADTGEGFDVASVGDPTEPQQLLRTGGRGVYLMRRLVDQLDYNSVGNRVRLIMERNGDGP